MLAALPLACCHLPRQRSGHAGDSGQEFRLLGLELGVGEDALGLELGQFLQLGDGVARWRGRRRWRRLLIVLLLWRLLILLLRILLVLLPGPAIDLPARDTVRYGRRRPGNDRGAGDAAQESGRDCCPFSVSQRSVASSAATMASCGM
jgi:hypothetical protein